MDLIDLSKEEVVVDVAKEELLEAHNELLRLSKHGKHGELWQRLVIAADFLNRPLDNAVVDGRLEATSSPSSLLRWLGGPLVGDATDSSTLSSPLEEIWECVDSSVAKRGLEVLVRRAANGNSGLETYPIDQLFSHRQLGTVHALLEKAIPVTETVVPALTGIVKITRRCNLRCTYCHDWSEGPGSTMPFETLAATMHWLVRSSQASRVNVVLHGGEPTLLGEAGLFRVLCLQRAFRACGQQIENRLQTNGTLLDNQIVRFLLHYRIGVGVSLDGPAELHDQSRPDRFGQPTTARAEFGLQLLRKAGLLNGALLVVTRATLAVGAEAIVEWAAKLELTNLGLLAARPGASETVTESNYLPTASYCQFLLGIERARRRILPTIAIREIDAALSSLHGDNPGTCELQGSCVGRYFSVEPDGSIAHCDKYFGDPRYNIGHVSSSYSEVLQSDQVRLLASQATVVLGRKQRCVWVEQCKGWCPHEDLVRRQIMDPTTSCCGLEPLFSGLEELERDHADA